MSQTYFWKTNPDHFLKQLLMKFVCMSFPETGLALDQKIGISKNVDQISKNCWSESSHEKSWKTYPNICPNFNFLADDSDQFMENSSMRIP